MTEDALAVIENKDANEAELSKALQSVGEIDKGPEFWKHIASDPSYRETHRARCAIQLFQRHVPPGTSLGELAELLSNPNWVADEDIEIVRHLRGEVPVTWNNEDTVISLRLFPQLAGVSAFAIYLRIAGKVDRGGFVDLLRRRETGETIREAKILEVGCIEPYQAP